MDVRLSPAARFLLGGSVGLCLAAPLYLPAQQPTQLPQAKRPVAEGIPIAAPQSTHFPILLLVQGLMPVAPQNSTPAPVPVEGTARVSLPVAAAPQLWSLRIGQKGPERFDRAGYPPIPLEPGEVDREGTTDNWTYHAKDSQTGAAVSVNIIREPCTDPSSAAKFVFTASVDHAQIGTLQGCARVAAELFPKINNQANEDDDDEDAKDKPAPPTVTHFKAPVAVAYTSGSGRLIIKRGSLVRSVPGKDDNQPCLSHDGKRLLYTSDEKGGERTIFVYDWATGKSPELLRGSVLEPFWSPDDTRIAFLKYDGSKWQVWVMPAEAPEKAALVYSGDVVSLQGWADNHTILADDLQTLSWIGDDGIVKQTLSSTELYGKDQFGLSSANTIRISPINPDLLLVSAEWLKPPQGVPVDPHMGRSMGFFTYEIRSKRRVILCPLNMFSGNAEWSRDGLQIFFTGWEAPGGAPTIYKMFWDGTSQTKYQDGRNLVIGE
jgi:uncharacterized membrane protein